MKILIAGLGSIGRRHLRNLRLLGEQDLLLYRTRRSTLPDDELQGLPFETDLAAALAHKPEAVIIANPTALHLQIAIPAAEQGCHLLLEKPISHSMAGIDLLQQAVQRGGGQVLVGFQFRFHPGLLRAQELLASGAIGTPLSARAHWGEYLPGWHPWEDYRQSYSARNDLGGGVVLTLSHPLDYLRWLLGEVQALSAFTGRSGSLDLNVEDLAEINLQFSSGVLGSLHLDYLQRPASHTLEIIGTRGTLRWDDADGAVRVWQSIEGADAQPGWQTHAAPDNFERNDLFVAEMRHFLQVARRQVASRCTLEDGVQALRLALSVYQSQAQGCKVDL